MRTNLAIVVVVLAIGLGVALVWSLNGELQAEDSGLDGTWTLISLKDANQVVHSPPANRKTTYTFDTTAKTMTVKHYMDESLATDFTVSFSISVEGNLEYADGDGHELTMSYVISESDLTLVYVLHDGVELGSPDLPYIDGQAPTASTVTPGPPQQLNLGR